MTRDSDMRSLSLFVEKAAYLGSLSSVVDLLEQGWGFTWTIGGPDGGSLERNAPSREQLDALALTLRLFIQDNECTSIRNVHDAFERLGASEELVNRYDAHRDLLNRSLDVPGALVFGPDEHPRVRDILETVLYGEMSHLKPDARDRYLRWVASAGPDLIEHEFVGAVVEVFVAVQRLATVVRMALDGMR